MLSHPQEIRAFLEHHEITVKKDSPSRDIKKFFSRIYKSNSRQEANRDAPHIFAAITPIYLEVSNWDTCLYLLRCKYKVSVCVCVCVLLVITGKKMVLNSSSPPQF